MNGYPPGFLERAMPHLRTPANRAHQRDELLRAARALNPGGMDMACSRGASMEAAVVEQIVEASRRGQFHPLRMLECIRCAVRWNADLLRPGRDGTSAIITLLQSIEPNKRAFNQALRIVERRYHGAMIRLQGQGMAWRDALDLINPSKPLDKPESAGEASAQVDSSSPGRAPKP